MKSWFNDEINSKPFHNAKSHPNYSKNPLIFSPIPSQANTHHFIALLLFSLFSPCSRTDVHSLALSPATLENVFLFGKEISHEIKRWRFFKTIVLWINEGQSIEDELTQWLHGLSKVPLRPFFVVMFSCCFF